MPNALAVGRAKRLIKELRIREPDEIKVELIAAHCRAHVKQRDLEREEGHLVRKGSSGLIVVDPRAYRSARWRFVVAHEIAHLLLHKDLDQSYLCTSDDLHDWYNRDGSETAANDFAAELLMPEQLFEPRCDRARPSFADVRELKDEFSTSLTATALRFVYYCPEACALVQSRDGAIEWWTGSESLPFTLKKGFKLTRETVAGDIFAGRDVEDRPELVEGGSWSDDSRADGRDVHEHSLGFSGYGTVLSLLWVPEA